MDDNRVRCQVYISSFRRSTYHSVPGFLFMLQFYFYSLHCCHVSLSAKPSPSFICVRHLRLAFPTLRCQRGHRKLEHDLQNKRGITKSLQKNNKEALKENYFSSWKKGCFWTAKKCTWCKRWIVVIAFEFFFHPSVSFFLINIKVLFIFHLNVSFSATQHICFFLSFCDD